MPKKWGHTLMTIIVSYLNRFKNTVRFLCKFAVKWILKIPLHLECVATLPCKTLMSTKQALSNKLQGSVAAYLRCGWVVNKNLKKVYCWVSEWKNFKLVNIWQSYKQWSDCLVHFVRLLAVCWPGMQSAWDHHTLACNFAKYSSIKKFFSLT